MATTARQGGRGRKLTKGTIRAPKRSGKTGTGFSASRLKKGTIRTQNRYRKGGDGEVKNA